MKIFILAVLISITSVAAFAQTDTGKTASKIEAGWGDLNYAVPESPAFKILGTSPSDIMRPTSVRDISFSIGNYFLNNGASIPQNLAVELSPSLFNPKVSLKDFKKDRFWYTSALSIGTKVNTDKSYAIGLGLKFRIIDKQDLRLSGELIKKYDEFGELNNTAYSSAIRAVTTKHMDADKNKLNYVQWRDKVATAYSDPASDNDRAIQKEVNDYIAKLFNTEQISALRDSVKNKNWNKPIWDIGVGLLFNSKDSLLRDIKPASKIGLWTTYGLPLGAKGQLLIGITGQLRDSLTNNLNVGTLNIGARAYYGSNDLKGFIEGNSLMESYQKGTFKGNVGIETTFFGGLWIDFSLGFSKQGDSKALFTTGFNILFANGEKKN